MNTTIGNALLKHLGLVGNSGAHTGSLVPRANTPNAQQQLYAEFTEAGKLGNPDVWASYTSLMRSPATYDSMLRLWDEMSEWDLMKAALVELVAEVTQVDQNSPAVIWYQCNDRQFEESLNDMLVRLNIEDIVQSQVWNLAAMGNHFEKIDYAPHEGVIGLCAAPVMEMRRYWMEKNRKCVGFRWLGHQPPSRDSAFVMPDNQTPVQRVAISQGQNIEDLWYPWDFLHFRRMCRLRISEHGEPIFDEAQGIYKKLRMAIDQMVVHRAQIQPDRYAINIDVQEASPVEQMKIVQRWRQALRNKLAFGQNGGTAGVNTANDFSSYYNAMALDTVLYVPQPKGYKHVIDKLAGTTQVPDVFDIELLTDLFYSIIGMPRSWFGGQKDQQSSPSGKALLAQDIRFLRKVKSLQKPLKERYAWLGYFHAILTNKPVADLDIKVLMSPIGSLEEQMKMEMLGTQTEILNGLADVMDKYQLPREAWVETIFKRYLHLPDDVVNAFITALPSPVEGVDAMLGDSQRRAAPSTQKLLKEVETRLADDPVTRRLMEKLRQSAACFADGPVEKARRVKYRTATDVLSLPTVAEHDALSGSMERRVAVKVSGENGRRIALTESAPNRVNGASSAPPAAPPAANVMGVWRRFMHK